MDANGYNVYRWNGDFYSRIAFVGGRSYTDTDVVPGRFEYHYVRAVKTNPPPVEESPVQEVDVIVAQPGGPASAMSPRVLRTTGKAASGIGLRWEGASGAVAYNVYKWDGTAFARIAYVAETHYTDPQPVSGANQYFVLGVSAQGVESPVQDATIVSVSGV